MNKNQFNLKINDVHIHIGKSSQIYQSFDDHDLLKFRRINAVENLLIFGTDLDVYTNNQTVKRLARELHFIYGLKWLDGISSVEIDDKIIGGKYHGAYLKRPIKPRWSVLEYLDKKNAVLMVHCGRYKEAERESNTSYLHALDVAETYPNIKVIMAHMGGTDTTVCKKAIHDSRDCENVYFDTSGITTPYIIEYALSKIEPNRILFGSDAPWCSFNAMVHTILDAHISNHDKNLILHQNFNDLITCKSPLKQSTEKLQ